MGGETAGETARDGRGRRRGPSMPRAATLVIDGPSDDSTGFVGLFTSQRFPAFSCGFSLDWCSIHLPFIIITPNLSFLVPFVIGSRDIRCSKGCNHHHHHHHHHHHQAVGVPMLPL